MTLHISPERAHGVCEGHFDYSETRLSANRSGKTAPKLVSLPKSPGTDLRHPTRRALAPDDQYREQPAPARATAIKRGRPHQTRPLSAPQWENPTARLFIVFPGDAPQDRRGVTPSGPRPLSCIWLKPRWGEGHSRERRASPLFVPQDHAPCGQCPPASLDVGRSR